MHRHLQWWSDIVKQFVCNCLYNEASLYLIVQRSSSLHTISKNCAWMPCKYKNISIDPLKNPTELLHTLPSTFYHRDFKITPTNSYRKKLIRVRLKASWTSLRLRHRACRRQKHVKVSIHRACTNFAKNSKLTRWTIHIFLCPKISMWN